MTETNPLDTSEEIIVANTGEESAPELDIPGEDGFTYDRDPLLDLDNGEYDADYQKALEEVRKEKENAEKTGKEAAKPEPSASKADASKEGAEKAPELALGTQKTTKSLKAKVGDGDIEIPLSAAIPVKIDGQETLVEIDELRRLYSSKQATKKEREQFLKEQRTYAADKDDLNRMVTEGLQAIAEGKIAAGLGVFAEMTGQDPFTVIKGLRRAIVESSKEYINLDEDEREKLDKIEEAEYYKEQRKKEAEKRKISDQRSAFTQQVLGVIEKFGISDVEEYNQYAQEAFDYVQKEKAAGRIDKSVVVTPETVGSYYLGQKTNQNVTAAVKAAAPEWLDSPEKLQAIWQYASQNHSSQEDLISVILESKNVSQTSSDAKVSKEPKQAPKPETEEDLFAELENIDPGLDLDKTPQLSRLKLKKK